MGANAGIDWAPLGLSFLVAAVATLAAGALGLALAAWLAHARFRGRDAIEVSLTLPLVLPPTVLGYYLLAALGRGSLAGRMAEAVTGAPIVFTRTGAIVAATVGALPVVVNAGRAAFESVDRTLVDAARTLGASAWQAFTSVELPLARRGVVAALSLAFARALGDFGATLMVAGDIPGETQTASLAIFDALQEHRERAALAMVLALTATTLGVLYVARTLLSRGAAR